MISKRGDRREQVGTSSYELYAAEVQSSLNLFAFILDNAMRNDYMTAIARCALDGSVELNVKSPGELAEISPGPLTLQIRNNKQLLLELFLSRLVDNFQCYIVGIIREILHAQPRVLINSQPTLSLEYVFQFQTVEELQKDVIEAKVNDLSYQGFIRLKQWCNEKGIPITASNDNEEKLVELISLRNIIVHNRGIIDKKYLRTHPNYANQLGSLRGIDVEDLFDAEKVLTEVVHDSDVAIREKYELPTGKTKKEKVKKRYSAS